MDFSLWPNIYVILKSILTPFGTALRGIIKKRCPKGNTAFGEFATEEWRYFLRYLSNQSIKLRCQRRLFWGWRTQWVSSGK